MASPVQNYIFLAIAIIALLVNVPLVKSQPPTFDPTSPCPDRCFRRFKQAFRDCRSLRRRPTPPCQIRRCTLNTAPNRQGFACALASPALSPPPSPPFRSEAPCPNRCFRRFKQAFRDCRSLRRRPIPQCVIRRCRPNPNRNRRGYICTSASTPTPSPSPVTSISPSPSLTGNPTSSPTPNFREATFRAGLGVSDDQVQMATDGSGARYRISYNATLASGGVVSLDSVGDHATITCNAEGSVRIQLSNGAPTTTSLTSMYPEGATLVISREIYGECILGPPLEFADESEDDRDLRLVTDSNAQLSRDAYLIIESVSGTPTDATVRGSASTFFAVFDEARLVVEIVSPPTAVRTTAGDEHSLDEVNIPTAARTVAVRLDSSLISLGPVQLRLTGTGESKGEFVSFIAEWNLASVNIEFKFINEWEFTLNVDLDIGVGVQSRSRTIRELVSVPLYGLPPIDFFNKLDTGPFTIPTFKLGFFFEIPLIFDVEAMVQRTLANVATFSYGTTRSEVTLFIRGPYLSLERGADTRTLAPARRNFNFMPSVANDESAEVTFGAFVGIRPQFAAYIPIFNARVSIDTGIALDGQYDFPSSSAFPPVTSGPSRRFGRCDQCHDLQIDAVGQIRNAGFFAGIGINLRFEVPVIRRNVSLPIRTNLAAITLPGNPSVDIDIARGCFLEPVGDDGPLVFIAEDNTCSICPDDEPVYNPTRQECEGQCDEDEPFFNQATESCEPCPPETPDFNEELSICEGACPGGTRAGNNVPFFGSFELGFRRGTFNFRWEHFTVPDRTEVMYEGEVIYDTGCTGGRDLVSLTYNGNATNVVVRVTPNCSGTSSTAWNFDVFCPS